MTHKYRITVETLASGQPRAYADSYHEVRVTFESTGWRAEDTELRPQYMSEQHARRYLQRIGVGFTEVLRSSSDYTWPTTYLEWLRPENARPASEVIPHGDPEQQIASVWHFRTCSPFTD